MDSFLHYTRDYTDDRRFMSGMDVNSKPTLTSVPVPATPTDGAESWECNMCHGITRYVKTRLDNLEKLLQEEVIIATDSSEDEDQHLANNCCLEQKHNFTC
eukprot:11821221-Ditylum_brightwellii.AAC.1